MKVSRKDWALFGPALAIPAARETILLQTRNPCQRPATLHFRLHWDAPTFNLAATSAQAPNHKGETMSQILAKARLPFTLSAKAITCATLAAALCASTGTAQAQNKPYFEGKTITLIVGGSPGDGYDVYARFFANYWNRHIPGAPRFIVQNMPGAGTLVAANYMFERAAKDGTVVATVGGGTASAQLFKTKGIRFDPRKYSWLGSLNSEVGLVLAWHTQPFKSARDLMEREMLVGGSGPTSGNIIFPLVLNRVVGTKFKIISGYKGTGAIALAMESGELQGTGSYHYSSLITSRPDWLEKKQVTPLIQLALFKHEKFPNVPNIPDLAKTEEQKAVLDLVFARQRMGRPFLGPPGLQPEVRNILHKAFADALKDKQFLADAEKRKLDLTMPMTGDEIHTFIESLYKYPQPTVEKAIAASDTSQYSNKK